VRRCPRYDTTQYARAPFRSNRRTGNPRPAGRTACALGFAPFSRHCAPARGRGAYCCAGCCGARRSAARRSHRPNARRPRAAIAGRDGSRPARAGSGSPAV